MRTASRPRSRRPRPFTIDYTDGAYTTDSTGVDTFNYHPTAKSVIGPHKFSYIFIQACIAILILVGFESVTSMGEEAKNPKRDLPWAILLSLTIQGAICYLFEYFAANYFLNSGYTLSIGGGVQRADRRHDGARGHLGLRQLRRRQGLHARPGRHGVPRPHRHDARLPEHRAPASPTPWAATRRSAPTSASSTART